jgi:hypothetical protein
VSKNPDDLGLVTLKITPIEGMNASDWAREDFASFRLISQAGHPSLKPFDGLDKMLLLSWIRRKFSGSDNQRFVLHYWDLRMPNIMVDDDHNLLR